MTNMQVCFLPPVCPVRAGFFSGIGGTDGPGARSNVGRGLKSQLPRPPDECPTERYFLAGESAGTEACFDVATAIAWTQRKLVFEHRRLGEVAEEFNRYNRTVIEIRSEELRAQEVTGVFQANDPGSFLAFLARIPGVAVNSARDERRFIVTQESPNTTVQQSK